MVMTMTSFDASTAMLLPWLTAAVVVAVGSLVLRVLGALLLLEEVQVRGWPWSLCRVSLGLVRATHGVGGGQVRGGEGGLFGSE